MSITLERGALVSVLGIGPDSELSKFFPPEIRLGQGMSFTEGEIKEFWPRIEHEERTIPVKFVVETAQPGQQVVIRFHSA